MSVDWSVLPLDLTLPDLVEWLQQEGIAVPNQHGRYPTLDELSTVLATFSDSAVRKEQVNEKLWEVVVGQLYSSTYAHMLGTVDQNGVFDFHFFGSGCQESTMLEILKRLSIRCGPFVLYEQFAATPVLVTSTITVDTVLAEWQRRIQVNHAKSFARDHKPG